MVEEYRQTQTRVQLASGQCRVGAAKQALPPVGRQPMAGFSAAGHWGADGPLPLYARCLYLEDAQTQEFAWVCIVDLMSASVRLLQEAVLALGDPELSNRLVLCGTHTHSAPGRFYGNRLYDRVAAALAIGGFQQDLTERYAAAIAKACAAARDGSRPGSVSVQSQLVWGPGGNRSLTVFDAARRAPEAPILPAPAPKDTDRWRRNVDPRLTVLCAQAEGKWVGVFGWLGVHATAMGRKARVFDRDWPGVAVDTAEAELGCVCAVGAGPAGDVSPLPSQVYKDHGTSRKEQAKLVERFQGEQLRDRVGKQVGEALLDAARGHAPGHAPLPINIDAGVFEVRTRGSVPRWQLGVPMLGGAEDGGPAVPFYDFFKEFIDEGFSSNEGPQRPKAPALGSLQAQAIGLLELSPWHPWYRLRVGGHQFLTAPGEPTTTAALLLEDNALTDLAASSASVIGYCGDYAGYFTSPAEYQFQHYEGASTLYGPQSLEWFRQDLFGPARTMPMRGSVAPPAAPEIPKRRVDALLERAQELAAPGEQRVRLLFAVEGEETPREPRLQLKVNSGEFISVADDSGGADATADTRSGVEACVRHFANPDPDAPRALTTFVAELPRPAQPLHAHELVFQLGNHQKKRAELVTRQAGAHDGRLPQSASPQPMRLSWIRRTIFLLTLLEFLSFATLLLFPTLVLELLGWSHQALDRLMMRQSALTFGLLGINLFFAKNTRDLRSLAGYAAALATHFLVIAGAMFWSSNWRTGSAFVGLALSMGWLWERIVAARGGRRVPSPQHWEFNRPMFWIGWLTLVFGALLLAFPDLFIWLFGIRGQRAAFWLRVFGGGFLVNTVSMLMCQHTRDLRVVRGQLLGSVLFDAVTLVLFAIAVATSLFNPWGLILLLPFLAITCVFPGIARRARARELADVRRPRTTREVAQVVVQAARHKRILRVVGSGHSVPGAIHAGSPPGPRPARPSTRPEVHMSLELMDQVVEVDRKNRLITVQAGMHIGEDPGHAASANNNLLEHLNHLDWALDDLGGIVHQTVGGFLATGSSGGTLQHAIQDNVVAMRFVDGQGNIVDAKRGTDLFDAVSVSMGLLGVVTEITFQCAERYLVRGRDFTASVDAATQRATLPTDGWQHPGIAPTEIALTSSGEDGLASYLQRVEYCRILWWPQQGASKMAIWEGCRTHEAPQEDMPYEPDAGLLQWVGGKALTFFGWSYGRGIMRVVGRRLRRAFLPLAIKAFLPNKRFYSGWDKNLPMDTHVDDAFIPVEFTELWFPLKHTAEVMQILFDMYEDQDVCGTFTVELYAAKAAKAWLSPAHAKDCFRVDIFWFQHNPADPTIEYFPQFWERLAHLAYLPHWAKYLPPPGSAQGASYLRKHYPKWDDFMKLRRQLDPDDVFLSPYWRRHLGGG